MNWKNLFMPGKDISASEARDYMAARAANSYQLLDVRQPKEYADGHLAGAILIPLPELPGRLTELDREKPVIVYCAIGGRSKAAAQLLAGSDFADVANMAGGIKAWHGQQAKGPQGAGLESFTGQEEYGDAVSLAYAMESGLQEFYRLLADKGADAGQRALFRQLMAFEEQHKARLAKQHQQARHEATAAPAPASNGLMEGGVRAQEIVSQMEGQWHGKQQILDFAMTLETQALDLYLRMARLSEAQANRDLFLRLADEENGHLAWLAAELDRTL